MNTNYLQNSALVLYIMMKYTSIQIKLKNMKQISVIYHLPPFPISRSRKLKTLVLVFLGPPLISSLPLSPSSTHPVYILIYILLLSLLSLPMITKFPKSKLMMIPFLGAINVELTSTINILLLTKVIQSKLRVIYVDTNKSLNKEKKGLNLNT